MLPKSQEVQVVQQPGLLNMVYNYFTDNTIPQAALAVTQDAKDSKVGEAAMIEALEKIVKSLSERSE